MGDKFEDRMDKMWDQIEDINTVLSKNQKNILPTTKRLLETISTQKKIFLNVSGSLATVHNDVHKLKKKYLKSYVPEKAQNPFKELKKELTTEDLKSSLPGLLKPKNNQNKQDNNQNKQNNSSGGQCSK